MSLAQLEEREQKAIEKLEEFAVCFDGNFCNFSGSHISNEMQDRKLDSIIIIIM